MRISRDVASFDSASAMLVATARYLHGQDFPALGKPATGVLLRPAMLLANRLPERARQALYMVGSGLEARPARRIAALDTEWLAERITRCYPRRPYQGAVIGSSSGALVHLCAALGIPWLPQTMLLPLRPEWRDVLSRGTEAGRFSDLDPAVYPSDLAVFVRYPEGLKRAPARSSLTPGPCPWSSSNTS